MCDSFQGLFNNPVFIKDYNSYIINNAKIDKCNSFLETVSIDKFKLNNSIKNKPKITNTPKNVSKNVITKDINILLNKLTIENIDETSVNMKKKLQNDLGIYSLLLTTILEKCIRQKGYCTLYIELINILYSDIDINHNDKISEFIDTFKFPKFEKNDDDNYDVMCDNNKKLDILLGYSQVVGVCESKNIVKGKIGVMFSKLIETYENNDNNDEKYRCMQCIYVILKELYKEGDISPEYKSRLNEILQVETNFKNKFKIMDIIERR
tara:strand:+ start:153 stop:950 length:798 start_codon:yes stop_codon:yes gene_type:complete